MERYRSGKEIFFSLLLSICRFRRCPLGTPGARNAHLPRSLNRLPRLRLNCFAGHERRPLWQRGTLLSRLLTVNGLELQRRLCHKNTPHGFAHGISPQEAQPPKGGGRAPGNAVLAIGWSWGWLAGSSKPCPADFSEAQKACPKQAAVLKRAGPTSCGTPSYCWV
jgi:hypothetical protein